MAQQPAVADESLQRLQVIFDVCYLCALMECNSANRNIMFIRTLSMETMIKRQKYENAVKSALKEDEADGSLLGEIDGGDLRGWGIKKLVDRKFVQKQIARLVTNNPKDLHSVADEGANAAPTAYM